MKIDRLSIRTRPPGRPIMYQTWKKLLFMHWPVPARVLRPLIPEALHIDTYDGRAWIGVTPFTMPTFRLRGTPALPLVSSTHELNVRTYVHHGGVPGVWFLSLDASNPVAVLGARVGFGLPYFQALMHFTEQQDTVRFASRRWHPGAPPASLQVTWTAGESLPPAQPGTLDFFLTERYCLYSMRQTRLFRTRIFHDPWPLRRAAVQDFGSTMLASHGLPVLQDKPLLHGQQEPLHVNIWRPSTVATA